MEQISENRLILFGGTGSTDLKENQIIGIELEPEEIEEMMKN